MSTELNSATSQSARHPADVVVIGAGIVGLCAALALQKDGLKVTLLDRNEPGLGCSFGNAGLLHAGGLIPMATPGALKSLPSMLLDPEGAVRIAWRHLPSLAPWLLRMAMQARPAQVEHNINALHALLKPSRRLYDALLQETGLQSLVKSGGELYLYRHRASMLGARWEMRVRQDKGIKVEELNAADIRELEPAVADSFQHAHFLPDSDMVTNPAKLSQGLAQYFVNQGGNLLRTEVRELEPDPAGGAHVKTANGALHAPRLVLSAGVWSGKLART